MVDKLDMMMTVIVGEPVLLRAVKKRDGDKEETGQDRYHRNVDEEEMRRGMILDFF